MELGQFTTDAQAARWFAVLGQGLKSLENLVGRLEEYGRYRLLRELLKEGSPVAFFVGREAGKEESPTGLSSGAECGCQGAGSGQAVNGYPKPVTLMDEFPAWVGNAGCTRVANQSAGTAPLHVVQEFVLNAIGGIFPI